MFGCKNGGERRREKRKGAKNEEEFNFHCSVWHRINRGKKFNNIFRQIYPSIRFLIFIIKLIKKLQICLTI